MAFGSIQNQNSAYGLKNEVDQILTNTNNIITTTGNIYTNTNQIQTTSNNILSKVNAIQTDIQQQQGNYNLNPTNVYKTIVSEGNPISFNANDYVIYASNEILYPGIYKLYISASNNKEYTVGLRFLIPEILTAYGTESSGASYPIFVYPTEKFSTGQQVDPTSDLATGYLFELGSKEQTVKEFIFQIFQPMYFWIYSGSVGTNIDSNLITINSLMLYN